MKARIPAVLVLALVFASAARADLQADISEKTFDASGQPTQRGKDFQSIYMKKGFMRLDGFIAAKNEKMSIVMDEGKSRAYMVNHSDQSYMIFELGQFQKQNKPQTYVVCGDLSRFDECMARENYKVVGHESADGHSCTVYARTKGDVTDKIWRPSDLGAVPLVKSASFKGGRLVREMHFTNIRTGGISDSVFQPPSGYRKMDMAEMIGKMQGMTPERIKQLQDMMRKRQQGAGGQ